MSDVPTESFTHRMSVVIPVYQGERTLPSVLAEIAPLTEGFETPDGYRAIVHEVVLAYDHGPDRSAELIRRLADEYSYVKAVWLSRNFGQHAATLAGIASSGGDWVVTLDEDGQHDPAAIGSMLDTAMRERADVVYAEPTNKPPHGYFRNTASKASKRLLETLFGGGKASHFNSYRLILGEVGRSVAAYSGTGVYLDVALSWVAAHIVTSPVELREEGDRRSGYSYRRLMAHFWRMILTSGTRGLRIVTATGLLVAAGGVVFAIYLIIMRFTSGDIPEGWTSQMVLTALCSGAILVALGVIAEYLGVAVNMALGKPAYLIVRDPSTGPLGQRLPENRD
ncbi:glycosyltransferase [Microbacterium sp. NPDC058389]|uniref:glycosyltransferase n=1 Tax=Microbacterium sp. NPDC058389 TaxID=3346475 RepID=UPI00366090D1